MGEQQRMMNLHAGPPEEGEGEGEGEEEGEEMRERSESGSYIRGSQVGRGARGGHRGGEGGDFRLRDASGSVASQGYDYVDSRDKWVSQGKSGGQVPRTVIIPLRQTLLAAAITGASPRTELSDAIEDYVDMKSVSSTGNPYLSLVRKDHSVLERLMEEDDAKQTDGDLWNERGDDPADYEHPVTSERSGEGEREGREGGHPGLGHKGTPLTPSLSGAVAVGGAVSGAVGGAVGGAVSGASASKSNVPKTKRYMNVNVKEFDPSMELFCSSDHHKAPEQSKPERPPPPTVASTEGAVGGEESRENAEGRYHDYINIDGDKLPPENPPIPKEQ